MSIPRIMATATATATATVAGGAASAPVVPALVVGGLVLAIAAGALHAILTAIVIVAVLAVLAAVVVAWLRRPPATVIVQPMIRVRLVEQDAPVPCSGCGLPCVTTAQITGPDGATQAAVCDDCLTRLLGEVERRALTEYGTTRPALEVHHDRER